MASLIRNPKDFAAGAIFTAAGLAAVLLGRQYSMGTATRMGPAYFPTTLGLVLVLIGFVVLARSFLQRGEPIQGLAVKPMLLIIGATVLFGALLRGAGLLVALALAVGLAAFSALVFVRALGLPLPVVGSWLGR